jgi:hypothetical protein
VWGVASAVWLAVLLAVASPVSAQAVLAATGVDPARLPPESRLTLRPESGLEPLAGKIARVLVLRGDTSVEVGTSPPPGLLEAVPAGHIALARDASGVRLVMGAALGESFEARVEVDAEGQMDPRSLALAVEALRDRAIETREYREPPSADLPAPPTAAEVPVPEQPLPPNPYGSARPPAGTRDEGVATSRNEPSEGAVRVEPLLFMRLYSGASPQSKALRTGLSTGGGLCVLGQCLLLAVEYPLPIALEAGGDDVRYRYPTFSCSFYSHPLQMGRFTPAIALGLLSRVGHFERDMGIADPHHGLETDLAVRGNIEGSYEIVDSVDLLAEAGLDFALDRWHPGQGDSAPYRGPRTAPWLQAGIRVRPY